MPFGFKWSQIHSSVPSTFCWWSLIFSYPSFVKESSRTFWTRSQTRAFSRFERRGMPAIPLGNIASEKDNVNLTFEPQVRPLRFFEVPTSNELLMTFWGHYERLRFSGVLRQRLGRKKMKNRGKRKHWGSEKKNKWLRFRQASAVFCPALRTSLTLSKSDQKYSD